MNCIHSATPGWFLYTLTRENDALELGCGLSISPPEADHLRRFYLALGHYPGRRTVSPAQELRAGSGLVVEALGTSRNLAVSPAAPVTNSLSKWRGD